MKKLLNTFILIFCMQTLIGIKAHATLCDGPEGELTTLNGGKGLLLREGLEVRYFERLNGRHSANITNSIRFVETLHTYEGKKNVRHTVESSRITAGIRGSYSPSFDGYYYEDSTGLYKWQGNAEEWFPQVTYSDPQLRIITESMNVAGGYYNDGKFSFGGQSYKGTLYTRRDSDREDPTTYYYFTGLGLIGYVGSRSGNRMSVTW